RRAARREKDGGGWLDESDCERAERWRSRVASRTDPDIWASRYTGPDSYARVNAYIQASLDQLAEAKAERLRLEREASEAELQRLEAEARRQRDRAERAQAEAARAEEDRKKAEAFAEATRRRSLIAIAGGALATLLGLVAIAFWYQASRERDRAEHMVRNAV